MPARWYAGGKGLDEFRKAMLNDEHISLITDFPNPKNCFPTANISGGVCFFLWDKKHTGDCLFTNVIDGETMTKRRRLNEYEVFVRYNNAISIIHKIAASKMLSSIIYTRNPFNLDSNVRGTDTRETESDITVYSSRGKGYIPELSITANKDLISKYKVMIGKVLSGHIGETDENGQVKVISTIQTLKPQEVSTDSYLVLGAFDNEIESHNLAIYLKTKFLRFMLLQSLASMNISRGNFRFVPIQDFTDSSDINWRRLTEDIDRQLYRKYGLTDEEIGFIEKMIKPME